MSDDIVIRLRRHELTFTMCDDAADEIERLRAELEKRVNASNSWEVRYTASFGEKYDADSLVESILKEVRGE